MGDLLMMGAAALVVAAIAAGVSRGEKGPGGGISPPGVGVLDRESALRAFLVAVAKEALDGFGSDKWFQVTEGRKGEKYSNCGDLVHAVIWWAGGRAPHVNRQSEGRQWKAGNIAELRQLFEAAKAWTWNPAPTDFLPGDCILIGDYSQGQPEHVAVVVSVSGTTITTADYGQAGQGGTIRIRHYALSGKKWSADDGRILVARGNVAALAYAHDPDPPTVLESAAVLAATRAWREAKGGANA